MQFTTRLATLADVAAIAQLWQSFAQEKASADPTLAVKQEFDFRVHTKHQLSKANTYCFILESDQWFDAVNGQQSTVSSAVGFLCTYTYTESPETNLLPTTPFIPRKLGMVLAFYINPAYRQLEAMNALIESAIDQAKALNVSDLELLLPEESGARNLVERLGFKKIATQYTKHLTRGSGTELPIAQNSLKSHSIPLTNMESNELVRDLNGQIVYLESLHDEGGKTLLNTAGLPIYPLPARDPQSLNWIFNGDGTIALCPPSVDAHGKIVEVDGIIQYCIPIFEVANGEVQVKRDLQGNCVFE